MNRAIHTGDTQVPAASDAGQIDAAQQSRAPLAAAQWVAEFSKFVADVASLSQSNTADRSVKFPEAAACRAQIHDSPFGTVAVADLVRSLLFCGKLRARATKPIVPVMCSARRVPATEDPRNLEVVEKLASRAHPLTGGGPGLMEAVSQLDFMARLADLTCSYVQRYPERTLKLVAALMQRTSLTEAELLDFCANHRIGASDKMPTNKEELFRNLESEFQNSEQSRQNGEYLALWLAMKSNHDMASIRAALKTDCGLTDRQIEDLGLEVFAVKIHIPSEAIKSRYISEDTQLIYFFGRKLPFAKEAKVAQVLTGGFGTYEELEELLQQGLHVIIFGEPWKPLVDRLQNSPNPELREMSQRLLHYCETPAQVEAALEKYLSGDLEKGRKPGERWFEERYGDQARQFIATLLGSEEEMLADARKLEKDCVSILTEEPEMLAEIARTQEDKTHYWQRTLGVVGLVTSEAISQALGKRHTKPDDSAELRRAQRVALKAIALRQVSYERNSLLEALKPDDMGEPRLDLRLLTWAVADIAVASSVQAMIPGRDGIAVLGSRTSYETYHTSGSDDIAATIRIQRMKRTLAEQFGAAIGKYDNTFVIPHARPDSAHALFVRAAFLERGGQAPHLIEIASSSLNGGSADPTLAQIGHSRIAVHSQFARELAVTKSTKGAILFEGGVNTEAFISEVLDGIATGKIPRAYRLVLVGEEWGNSVLKTIQPLIEARVADSFPLDSVLVTEDPTEAARFLGLNDTREREDSQGGQLSGLVAPKPS